mmetsp:Transcript_19620/g.41128  ORF Transcript_19620/g.41128 Transcript_19620/m.41128 type:complete len:90 (+) Transcript_19620:24-293(+)
MILTSCIISTSNVTRFSPAKARLSPFLGCNKSTKYISNCRENTVGLVRHKFPLKKDLSTKKPATCKAHQHSMCFTGDRRRQSTFHIPNI